MTDEELRDAKKAFAFNTPTTKEEYYYRKIFQEMFPGECFAKTVVKWNPRIDWGCSSDPSGRAQPAHNTGA